MMALSGISVSRGIAIGKAAVLRRGELNISEYTIPSPLIQEEIARFRSALLKAKRQLRAIREEIPAEAPPEVTALVDTHLVMFEDHTLRDGPIEIIRTRRCNAEWALKLQRDVLMQVFEEMDDPYLRARKDDIDHVVNRILQNLQGQAPVPEEILDHRTRGAVVIADDLSPAEIMLMQKHGIAAFITEFGGPNSHTAILARSLGVPAIVGVHYARRYIRHGDEIVVEGRQGMIIVGPSPVEVGWFRGCQREERRYRAELSKLRRRPAVTHDGHRITLMANAEIVEDVEAAINVGAEGVGLFRTEMLFMNRDALPDEEEQYETYLRIVRAMKGLPVTIRTLDLGMDKWIGESRPGAEGCNPAMGLRAIRWCLKDPAMFSTQVRAILRASAHGRVRMMFPMLSSEGELMQVLGLVEQEKNALRDEGEAFDEGIELGAMIEVPAAALQVGAFARHVDFLSIGTNDLIQYTLAVDRLDEEVNYLYDPLHPAVLKLIRMIITAGRRAGVPVSMCGEMAGDPYYTRLLLGMGLREFSAGPGRLLEVKRVIVDSELGVLTPRARRVLRLSDRSSIRDHLDRMAPPLLAPG